jgi:polyisoprenoid-binding protein YceI
MGRLFFIVGSSAGWLHFFIQTRCNIYMKTVILLILTILASNIMQAQYKPVDKGSTLQFKIQNLGFDINGTFTGFKGAINFDAQNPDNSSFDVTIDANTINTDNSLRDSHLRDNGYFDVKDYPVIHFVSAKITPSGKAGAFTVTGKLSIKGKSQDISFPFTATASNDDYIFKGSFKIKRKDFGVGGTSTVSNELEVFLNVLSKKA